MILQPGDKAPSFTLRNADNEPMSVRSFRGKVLVLYFYSQDNTETCTLQACDFRDNLSRLSTHGVNVVGVSPDTVPSHRKFTDDHALNFALLSDPSHSVCEKYGVWQQKTLFGNTYMGVVRSTFVIDKAGTIRAVFSPVRLKGQIDKLLTAIQTL